MAQLTRRAFVELSTGALLGASAPKLHSQSDKPVISSGDGSIRVEGPDYFWKYFSGDDTFQLHDSEERLIVTGTVQPVVVVAPRNASGNRRCKLGKVAGSHTGPGRVRIDYAGVNGNSNLSITWRFDSSGLWIDPILYDSTAAEEVVSLHYFSRVSRNQPLPSLDCTFLVVPGINESSAISPIVNKQIRIHQDVWLGHGNTGRGANQAWGLPVDYFCGFSTDRSGGSRDAYTKNESAAFACGLADLPNGDLFLSLRGGKSSPWIAYRSDIWHQLQGPGKFKLGAPLFWAVGANYYEAISRYYAGLSDAGLIRRKPNSSAKTAAALTPQFCTWGAQVARGKTAGLLDEAFLTEIYEELKASGMKAGMFSIDAKWEEKAGTLEHSTTRFPHFEQFLEQVRSDGRKIGMWVGPMRCEDPSALSLSEHNMVLRPDGTPYAAGKYYIVDVTQPEVAKAVGDRARQFMRRYKPDLVKFDYGYELPGLDAAAPKDKRWAGERLLSKGFDVVVSAMREVNPELVVMYPLLSPLYLDHIDLVSPDDLLLAMGEYDLQANRRFFFNSLLGRLGVPTYGSSGYDWASTSNIWFDSAVVGTLGSLNDFRGDEEGEHSTPERIARYNGLTHVLRPSNTFEVTPLGVVYQAPTRGARARSWARRENGQLVLLALRPSPTGGVDPLSRRGNPKNLKDAVRCNVPVVVASQEQKGIGNCARLALVAYGDAEVGIRRSWGSQAKLSAHYFGGGTEDTTSTIENGWLNLRVPQKNAEGSPIEWIEVVISA